MITGTLKPLGDRVVVRPDKVEEDGETKSGLITPGKKEKSLTGIVLAVGPGKRLPDGKLQPPDIKVGSKVYYAKFSGVEMVTNKEEVLILHEDEIYGVVE